MHRILILRHDEAALARLREVLESCGEHLAIESVDDVARGLARLTTGAADGDPFAAAFVAGEAPGETLAALWAAEPDLQVVLSREAHEPVDELPDDDSGRVPLVIRRPLDAVAVRLLVRVLLEKRALQAEVRDEHECVTSLRSSNRRLEEATRAKSEFLANMSHEIRTPMTAILGYADLLREPGLPRSDFHTYLGVIRRNGDHLLRLINDILDLSKIEAGRMVLERVECSLDELLDDVMGSLRASARQKGLEFGLRLQGALPTRLSTDPVRVRQVLLNLVGNAIKFTQTGGVRVTVRMRAPENRLAIVVEDGVVLVCPLDRAEEVKGLAMRMKDAD